MQQAAKKLYEALDKKCLTIKIDLLASLLRK